MMIKMMTMITMMIMTMIMTMIIANMLDTTQYIMLNMAHLCVTLMTGDLT